MCGEHKYILLIKKIASSCTSRLNKYWNTGRPTQNICLSIEAFTERNLSLTHQISTVKEIGCDVRFLTKILSLLSAFEGFLTV